MKPVEVFEIKYGLCNKSQVNLLKLVLVDTQ